MRIPTDEQFHLLAYRSRFNAAHVRQCIGPSFAQVMAGRPFATKFLQKPMVSCHHLESDKFERIFYENAFENVICKF